jgi:hypothetical protein
MSSRLWAALVALAGALVFGFATAAAGPDQREQRRVIGDGRADTPVEIDALHEQHGGPGGHLPGSRKNVRLVGQVDIEGAAPGRVADVSAFGNYAYLTVRDPEGCSDAGVAVIDISDPSNPVQVGFIDSTEGSFPGEGSQVVKLKTESFEGRVLVFNNEICALGGEGGVSLWDVTDPLNPQVLTAHAGDTPGGVSTFIQIHSAFAWQAGKRAFVVMTDNEEFPDVDILEITDPRNPELIAEYDMNEFEVAQPEIGLTDSFLHDMVVKKIGRRYIMLVSYWDGGFVQLDVTDPANAVFLGDTDFTNPDPLLLERTGVELTPEGNAHQAEFARRNRFFLGTDEDFAPFRADTFEITTGPNAGEYPVVTVQGAAAISSLPDQVLNGPTVYVGYACPESAPVPPPPDIPLAEGEELIAVVQRGPEDDPSAPEEACFPGEKAETAIAAGYDAVLFVNRHQGSAEADAVPFCGAGAFPEEPIVALACTTHEAFHLIFNTEPNFDLPYPPEPNTEPDIGAVGEKVMATDIFDGWGYVHLYNRRTFEEVDTYAITEAMDPDFAIGFGDLTVHEVAVDPFKPRLAYLSYYAGGLRVIKYGRNGIREVGHYIDEEGNNFWGVEVHRLPSGRKLILASDRDSGLWIFRYTGR